MTRIMPHATSRVVTNCQVCDSSDLESVLFLGYLPPVNQMQAVGERPVEQPVYPAELLYCRDCTLVQLGCIVDPAVLFPPEYPYVSGTTRALHANFDDLAAESREMLGLGADDLVVDVGSNDGTLLSKFAERHRVQGVEPTKAGALAVAAGLPTIPAFFSRVVAKELCARRGGATLITAANVFAHVADVHGFVEGVLDLLAPNGVFVTESHYLDSLLKGLQYDTIYHEHLRYYSLRSLTHLLEMHGLEVIYTKRIPTHGGSVRVYAARKGWRTVRPFDPGLLTSEEAWPRRLPDFAVRVARSKCDLYALLADRKLPIVGIGAPSRASTLINYLGLDANILSCVFEVEGSPKLGKYMPGTRIPVMDEKYLDMARVDAALLLSWHIAEELTPKVRTRGFTGDLIVPLPEPHGVYDL